MLQQDVLTTRACAVPYGMESASMQKTHSASCSLYKFLLAKQNQQQTGSGPHELTDGRPIVRDLEPEPRGDGREAKRRQELRLHKPPVPLAIGHPERYQCAALRDSWGAFSRGSSAANKASPPAGTGPCSARSDVIGLCCKEICDIKLGQESKAQGQQKMTAVLWCRPSSRTKLEVRGPRPSA